MMPHIIHELAHAMPSQQRAQLFPPPGSEAETIAFQQLQTHFAAQYEAVFPHPLAAKTVVIVPSLTLDQEILAKVNGHVFYEERLLCLLMLLRMPRTHVIYVTSVPVDPCIIDYYLHLLPGITGYHARQRLHLLSCFDASAQSLTQKILTRPRLMARLQQCIPNGHPAHIACFNVTDLEKTLAVRLGLPIYGCDPALAPLGSKSGSRQLFRQCGVPVPPGFENLRNETEVAMALTDLKKAHPTLRKAVVKLNEGFSGDGNALFDYQGLEPTDALAQQLQDQLPQRLKIVAHQLGYAGFMQKLSAMHGVAEAFVEGDTVTSPSVQCRISPLGQVDVVSTHDQVLGGESGQVFMGAHFPARADYATELGHMGHTIGQAMKERGVLGRFGVDFMSVRQADGWHHYAIEINLRKGGTTHPFLMLQFLTNGQYHANTGRYTMHDGQERFYFATDNLQNDRYKGLTPHDLIDIAMCHGLHYNGSSEEGVMFHLIGALSQYGKLGMVCVGKTMQRAEAFYQQTIRVLEGECAE